MKVPLTVWISNKFEPTCNVDQISQNREKNPSFEKKSQTIQIYAYEAGTSLNYKFDIYFID